VHPAERLHFERDWPKTLDNFFLAETVQTAIEGGLCVRRVEDFIAGSERRCFVLNRTPYAAEPDATIPESATYCAEAIASPFFSVDVARRVDGVERIVEIGDGQVSDVVGWSVERFVNIWREVG
jgi:ATP-grasp domain, R2K clade family 3